MSISAERNVQEQLRLLDEAVALSRVGGDRGLLREVVELFLIDYPETLAKIRTAISARDTAALEHHAHSLKGSVATFAAQDVFDAALALEKKGRTADLRDVETGLSRLESALVALRPELEVLHAK